jgi:predicted nucleic acid-binding protein
LPKPAAVIDASCVIALDQLNLLPQLSFLFARLLIPKAVRAELYRRRATKDRLRALLREYSFVLRCSDYDAGAVDLLLTDRSLGGTKDRGEAEAVVQASQLGAAVLVDEPWGRKLAERHRLRYHGTLWVLERLCQLGLLTTANVREHVQQLLKHGYRLPAEAVNDLLGRVGERAI